jgi:formylglycine-generating enzyme required for sulfatase activity
MKKLRHYKNFDFSVVKVNEKGEIIHTETKSAKYLTVELKNQIGLDLILIPAGKFMMGSVESEKDSQDNERPQLETSVESFLMGKYPVTQEQWEAVMGNNPSSFQEKNLPVEGVSSHDCLNFCKKLSRQTSLQFRLPSEAEWEYACRANADTPFYCGETITTELANYNGDYTYNSESKGVYRGQTTRVGIFPPNSFGLYDLHGNVWEWCADNWQDKYVDGSINSRACLNYYPVVMRGGSWYNFPWHCRSACRGCESMFARNYYTGFRLVADIPKYF